MAFHHLCQKPFYAESGSCPKCLPPGNVMELYEEYKATQQMLGGHHVSHLVFYLSMGTNHVPSTQIRKLLEPRVSCEILRIVNLSTAGGNEWQKSYINIYKCCDWTNPKSTLATAFQNPLHAVFSLTTRAKQVSGFEAAGAAKAGWPQVF